MQAITQWVSTSYNYLTSVCKQCKTTYINEINVFINIAMENINSSIAIEMMWQTMYLINHLLNKCFQPSPNCLSFKGVASRWNNQV
jgi:hypothetical protein